MVKGKWSEKEEQRLIEVVRDLCKRPASALKHADDFWKEVADRISTQFRVDRSSGACKNKYAGIRISVGFDERPLIDDCLKAHNREVAASKPTPKAVARKVAPLPKRRDGIPMVTSGGAPSSSGKKARNESTGDVEMSDENSLALRAERKEKLLRYAGEYAKHLGGRFKGAPPNSYIREIAKLASPTTSGDYDWQQARLDAGDLAPVLIVKPYLDGGPKTFKKLLNASKSPNYVPEKAPTAGGLRIVRPCLNRTYPPPETPAPFIEVSDDEPEVEEVERVMRVKDISPRQPPRWKDDVKELVEYVWEQAVARRDWLMDTNRIETIHDRRRDREAVKQEVVRRLKEAQLEVLQWYPLDPTVTIEVRRA